MSKEQLLISNNKGAVIAPPDKLEHLVTTSFATLESILNNQEIPGQERAAIALKILEMAGSSSQPITQKLTTSQANGSPKPEQPINKGVDNNWKLWIATNKLRGAPDDLLVQAMVQTGIDEQVARQEMNNVASDPSFQAGSDVSQLMRKLESILEVSRKLDELSPNFGIIERRSNLSQQEFLENYYAKNKPVIITDSMDDWQAMSLWTPDHLKTKYGDVPVEIQANRSSDPEYEIKCELYKKTVKLSEFVEMVQEGGDSNDYYIVANNGNLEREELKSLLYDIIFPEFLDESNTSNRVFFWFGPAGTITPLHHDPCNLIMAHVYGRKQWRLISPNQTPLLYNYVGVFSQVDLENPDYNAYPLFKDVNIIEAVLEPGEIIFIPVGWWHQVKAMDTTISLSFTNFVFPNSYNYFQPHIRSQERENTQAKVDPQITNSQQQLLTAQYPPLTNEIVENTNASYLVDEIFKGEVLIVSFGYADWDNSPRFDFYGRTKKLANLAKKPINRIFVRDLSNGWYHQGIPGLGTDIHEIVESLKKLIAQISPSRVITIGQSMGAYAAIMFGQLLDADGVLAFGPLSLLNLQKTQELGDTRSWPIMEALAANPPKVGYFDLLTLCQESNHSPEIKIFYGEKPDADTPGGVNFDRFHATRLNVLPNCTIYPYKDSGHVIVPYLIEQKLIDNLLLEAVFGLKAKAPSSIPENWSDWVEENIARGVPSEELASVLLKQGFLAADIKAEINQMQTAIV